MPPFCCLTAEMKGKCDKQTSYINEYILRDIVCMRVGVRVGVHVGVGVCACMCGCAHVDMCVWCVCMHVFPQNFQQVNFSNIYTPEYPIFTYSTIDPKGTKTT